MRKCPWCEGSTQGDFEPFDSAEARERLCRWHQAEYEGTSLNGLDRMDAAERADMADLGYFD